MDIKSRGYLLVCGKHAQTKGYVKAKILRMTYDPEGAIAVLKEGLNPEKPGHFVQADALASDLFYNEAIVNNGNL